MNVYSFALNPELHQPSGISNLSNIDNITIVQNNESTNNNFKREKNKFYFKNIKESTTRKYLNNWSELREFIGYNDVDIKNNEIIINNKPTYQLYPIKNDKLKILTGMPIDFAFSN